MVRDNITFGYKPSSSEVDITDINSIDNYISNKKINCIINLASTNINESENNKIKAVNVNINGTINLINISKKLDIPIVFISTGAVFSSNNYNEKFNENNKTCPNSFYGITKDISEKIALLYNKSIIIRTGWLFGGNKPNHYKFVENTINKLLVDIPIKATNDCYGSPTYVLDLIEKMYTIILNKQYGIHHIVNSDNGTGYDIALEIANKLNKNKNLIESVSIHTIPNLCLFRSNSEILESLNNDNKLRSWKDSLNIYIDKYIQKLNIH